MEKSVKIGIGGAGGIGSNVAVNLLRSGFNNLKIVDFDVIDESNLNRQFYFKDQVGRVKVETLKENLLRIDPAATIEVITNKLEEDNLYDTFADCDAVVEGFDVKETKKLMLETFAASGKPMVAASGIAGVEIDNLTFRKLGKCYIAGDFATDVADAKVYSHKVQMVAAMMAGLLIKKLV